MLNLRTTSGNINEPNLKDVMTELRSMGRKMDEMKSGIEELKQTTDRVDKRCKDVEEEVTNLRKENRQLRNKLDNLDGQIRRNNVIVQGIPESEGKETRAECEEAVKNCLQQDMGLDEDIRIERAHRLPKPYAMRDKGYPRDIIVKLSFYKDKENILHQARSRKPKNIFIKEDFSDAVKKARFKLKGVLTAAREKELVSFMSFNKLVVISKANNKRNTYVYDDANDCVKALHKNFNDELDITK